MKRIFLSLTVFAFAQTPAFAQEAGPAAETQPVVSQSPRTQALEQAQALGAPMAAVQRALEEQKKSSYQNKNVIGLFDISRPSAFKRFFLIDLKNGKTTAHYIAHGKGNGDNLRPTRFSGFQNGATNMTPLGPFRTGASTERHADFVSIQDRYISGKVYRGLQILDMEGTASYNKHFNRRTPNHWVVFHPAWYATEGYRKANPNMLGRSLGCLAMDPVESNEVFGKLSGRALIYITVGDKTIESYL